MEIETETERHTDTDTQTLTDEEREEITHRRASSFRYLIVSKTK